MKPCTYATYVGGRYMVCTLREHAGPHILWAGKRPNSLRRTPVHTTVGSENRVVPALREQPGTVAETDKKSRHA